MTIEGDYRRFDALNPEVYDTLVDLAYEAKESGTSKIGIGLIWEVMRWRMMIATRGDDFKLNNNFRSRYVRRLIEEHPDLESMFNLRILRSA